MRDPALVEIRAEKARYWREFRARCGGVYARLHWRSDQRWVTKIAKLGAAPTAYALRTKTEPPPHHGEYCVMDWPR